MQNLLFCEKNMKKLLVLVVCVVLVASLFAACATETTPEESVTEESVTEEESTTEEVAEEETPAEGGRIFCTNAFYTAPYCGPLNQSMIDTAAEYGYDLTIVDGESDGAKQLDQIETAITEGYDAIIYIPADGASSINITKRLADSGIPCINDNSRVDDSVADLIPYVGIDPYSQGVTAAEMTMEVLPDGGNVVIVQGLGGTAVELGRTSGFEDTIADNIKILAKQNADWDPATALTVTQDFISKYGDEIDVIYTQDDGMYEGAVQAVEEAGMTDKIKIISVSGNSAGIQGIKDGKLYCTVAHSPIDEGKLCIDTLMKIINGEDYEWETILESLPVTAENVDDPAFANPGW